jgi:hypothetical protein
MMPIRPSGLYQPWRLSEKCPPVSEVQLSWLGLARKQFTFDEVRLMFE